MPPSPLSFLVQSLMRRTHKRLPCMAVLCNTTKCVRETSIAFTTALIVGHHSLICQIRYYMEQSCVCSTPCVPIRSTRRHKWRNFASPIAFQKLTSCTDAHGRNEHYFFWQLVQPLLQTAQCMHADVSCRKGIALARHGKPRWACRGNWSCHIACWEGGSSYAKIRSHSFDRMVAYPQRSDEHGCGITVSKLAVSRICRRFRCEGSASGGFDELLRRDAGARRSSKGMHPSSWTGAVGSAATKLGGVRWVRPMRVERAFQNQMYPKKKLLDPFRCCVCDRQGGSGSACINSVKVYSASTALSACSMRLQFFKACEAGSPDSRLCLV